MRLLGNQVVAMVDLELFGDMVGLFYDFIETELLLGGLPMRIRQYSRFVVFGIAFSLFSFVHGIDAGRSSHDQLSIEKKLGFSTANPSVVDVAVISDAPRGITIRGNVDEGSLIRVLGNSEPLQIDALAMLSERERERLKGKKLPLTLIAISGFHYEVYFGYGEGITVHLDMSSETPRVESAWFTQS